MGEAELASVHDGAAEDAAEDVVSAFVAGEYAVGDGAGETAGVVGEHAEDDVLLLDVGHVGEVGGEGALVGVAGELGELGEEGVEEVGVVVGGWSREVGEVLGGGDDAGDALEAHAGIDVLVFEGDEVALGGGVELDEDEVPDFDAVGGVGVDELAAGVAGGGEIDVEFGAGAAGAGVAHHPEVVLLAAEDDVDGGVESGFFEYGFPEVVGLLVEGGWVSGLGLVDGGVEAVFGEFPDFGD